MLRHPFERLSLHAVGTAALALLAVWFVLTMLLAAAVPVAHLAQLAHLLRAADANAAAALVAAWSPDLRATAGFVLGFDFIYDLTHDNAVALLCIWAARRHGGRRVVVTARAVAWVVWLDVLLNVPENLAALHIVREAAPTRWFALVVSITSFRFVTLWAGFAFGAVTLAIVHGAKGSGVRC